MKKSSYTLNLKPVFFTRLQEPGHKKLLTEQRFRLF